VAEWEEKRKLLLLCFYVGCAEHYPGMLGLHSTPDSLVEVRKGELIWWGEIASAMLRRNILTQKSKLKTNRIYFSNFKVLMPWDILVLKRRRKKRKEGSYSTLQVGTRDSKAQCSRFKDH
jgi:hypothetical protein